MPDRLRVGIVGCGSVAKERHIPGFMKIQNKVTLQATCDSHESLANDVAKQYNMPRVYSDISEMLTRENLDIVDICTPQQVHAPLTVQALEHGCHVLVEKPMALQTSACDEMIEASRKSGVKLCVAHNILFHPPFLKARELMAQGAIGKFTGMRILISDHRDEMLMRKDYWVHKLPGGLIGETGPHTVYMSLAFLNQVINIDVLAKNFLEHSWTPFDEFRIELEGENAISSIAISYATNRHNCHVDIFGTEGVLHLNLNSMLLVHEGPRNSLKPIDLARYSLGTAFQITKGVAINAFKVATKNVKLGHDVIIEIFVDSILSNQQPPVTGKEGRETVRVMEMIAGKLSAIRRIEDRQKMEAAPTL